MDPIPALAALLMTAKPLSEIHIEQQKWTDVASGLKTAFPRVAGQDKVVHLGAAYYAFDQPRKISLLETQKPDLVTAAVDFLESLMNANGQWAYINRQGWFQRRDYAIGIDLTYYPDRSQGGYQLSPQFHKDTGGNNLFVNLIFDNKIPIEATEWFVDVAEPGNARAKWQAKLLPQEHLTELANLRRYLQERRATEQTQLQVQGGVLEGANICVSWLDDLVWHATPSLNERIVYSATLAKAHYDWANAAADIMHSVTTQKGGLDYYDDHRSFYYTYYDGGNNEKWIHLVELLGTIADDSSTALIAWLTKQGKRAQDIDCDVAREAWAAVYAGSDGRARFARDADLRGRVEWRMTGQIAVANAFEKRLKTTRRSLTRPRLWSRRSACRRSGGPTARAPRSSRRNSRKRPQPTRTYRARSSEPGCGSCPRTVTSYTRPVSSSTDSPRAPMPTHCRARIGVVLRQPTSTALNDIKPQVNNPLNRHDRTQVTTFA
jgi:hypothetical protein